MKEKIIYTKWLAYQLRQQGFKFLRTEVNPNFPQYLTYIFEDNLDLQIAISALTRARKQHNNVY